MKTESKLQKTLRELTNMRACDIGTLSTAHRDMEKAGKSRYMVSGVIVKITDLNGRVVVDSFMVSDGLSDESINALKKDIQATYEYRLAMNKLKF